MLFLKWMRSMYRKSGAKCGYEDDNVEDNSYNNGNDITTFRHQYIVERTFEKSKAFNLCVETNYVKKLPAIACYDTNMPNATMCIRVLCMCIPPFDLTWLALWYVWAAAFFVFHAREIHFFLRLNAASLHTVSII